MNLRNNPKQKSLYYAGTIKSGQKENKRKLRRERYARKIAKETAITSNMMKLIMVAQSNDPLVHLEFWKENLQSDYPVIEIKKSNLTYGGIGVFVTSNCFFLPRNLMYIPHSLIEPQLNPAEEGTQMSDYQFAIYKGNAISYIFPTLDPNPKLPCAQFINTPLRKTQGYYKDNVSEGCLQAMHTGNVSLLGRYPGGFLGHQIIYPGFEILGPYMSAHHLPIVSDYHHNRVNYDKRWKDETKEALKKQGNWVKEIKENFKKEITYWKKAAHNIYLKLNKNTPSYTILALEYDQDDDNDEDYQDDRNK